MRRTVKAVATSGFLGFAIVGLATPSYADTTVNITVSGPARTDTATADPSVAFGPTVIIYVNRDVRIVSNLLYRYGDPSDNCNDDGNNTGCFLEGGDDPYEFSVGSSAVDERVDINFNGGGNNPNLGFFTVSYAVPSEGSVESVVGPAPHIQQFPMPATGTCDEAEPEGVNWSGVASGGWGESWAWWMNDGGGGDVCTRTLVYNASTAAWEVD